MKLVDLRLEFYGLTERKGAYWRRKVEKTQFEKKMWKNKLHS